MQRLGARAYGILGFRVLTGLAKVFGYRSGCIGFTA